MRRWTAPLSLLLAALAAGLWAMLWERSAPARVYVACSGSNHVAVLDPELHQVVARIPTDDHPIELMVSPDGRRLFVANAWANTVQIFDRATGRLLSRYMTPPKPSAMSLSPDGRVLRVAHVEDSRDTFLHLEPDPPAEGEPTTVKAPKLERLPRTAQHYVNMPETEAAGVARPKGRDFFLDVSPTVPALLVTDPRERSVRSRIPLGGEPSDLVLGPGDRKVYVAVRSDNTIAVVDVDSLVVERRLPAGKGPARMVKTPGARFTYVVNVDDRTVSVLDMVRDEIRQTIEVGDAPLGAVAWPKAPENPPQKIP